MIIKLNIGDLYEGLYFMKRCSSDLNSWNILFSQTANIRIFPVEIRNTLNIDIYLPCELDRRIRNTPRVKRSVPANPIAPDHCRIDPNSCSRLESPSPRQSERVTILPEFFRSIQTPWSRAFSILFRFFFNVFYILHVRTIYSLLEFVQWSKIDQHSRFIYEVAIRRRRCFITHVFWPMRIRWPADEYLTIGLFTVLIDDAQSTLLLRLMARFGWLRVTGTSAR